MKQQVCALLGAALLAMGAGALAQTATYAVPYEAIPPYAAGEDETELTQTNLSEHEEPLKSLGTTREAAAGQPACLRHCDGGHPERRRADCPSA
ncbi:MAG: hypothetical protein ACLVB5_06500 [Christensenellales bacterium]